MFYVGRFLQIVGLGLTGIGCLIAFDKETTEGTFFAFGLAGLVVFFLGHAIIPKR